MSQPAASRRWSVRVALAAGLWLSLACTAFAQVPKPPDGMTYTVGVVPQFQASEVHRVWAPILARLSAELGVQLQLKPSKDIPAFEDEFQSGQFDLVYLNPYHQLMAAKAQGYVPLVRDSKPLSGILVVRQDDPIRTVRQLQGQTVAYPAPNALGASLLIRSHLAEVDKIDTQTFYAKTHTNAYRQVLMGKAAASGGLRATLEREPDEVRKALRVLMETPGVAPHPLSAHPRVPAAVQQAVLAAVLRLADDPALQPSFKDVPMPRPVRADQARDYEPLGRLRLDKYVE